MEMVIIMDIDLTFSLGYGVGFGFAGYILLSLIGYGVRKSLSFFN